MQERIDAKAAELTADLVPKNSVERLLVTIIARESVKVDVCNKQMQVNELMAREEFEETWDDQRRQEANRLAARLASNPCGVKQQLEDTLHGAQWCLAQWRELGESVVEHGFLTEPQRQFCCDLMGILPLFRDHTAKVPACDATEDLLKLVAEQFDRLKDRIGHVLEQRDKHARKKVRLGLPIPPDATTKKIKSNEARAYKRMVWGYESLQALRRGVSPATLIDPATRKPIQPEEEPPPPPPQGTAADAPPPETASPASAGAQVDPTPADPITVPHNLSREDKEMLCLVGSELRDLLRAGMLKLPKLPEGTPGGTPPQS
jgi:hypothetical protein